MEATSSSSITTDSSAIPTLPPTTTESTIVSLSGDWSSTYLMDSPPSTPEGSIPPSPLAGSIRRHKNYYFDNDQVIFLVEDTLFNVHRSLLMRHSTVFKDMFEMPSGPVSGESVEGSNDENPVRLENVRAVDFERLLSILYPSVIGKYSATLPEWISILQLATRWLFDDIRTLAITELTDLKIDPVQKVAIALQCDIPEWLHSSYVALCLRQYPLTLDEGRKLGVDVVTKLAYTREVYRDNSHISHREDYASKLVTDVFGTTPSKRDDKPPELVLKWNGVLNGPSFNNLPNLSHIRI
ncbi:hypothetical protein Clacol_002624 [Clathrus columnatus]|uniref:BTB domain-containing protein n=1 Tax=Clathrus columnatus TaxID=1419009 RepID=A0AAV5A5C5_9AGAM|nr:hypothetical protein Clacol_002624 [Clathrus columnatus]